MSSNTGSSNKILASKPQSRKPPLLLSKPAKAPPSETARLLTALLDGKPSKKRARCSASNSGTNNGRAANRQRNNINATQAVAAVKCVPNKRVKTDSDNGNYTATDSTAWSHVTATTESTMPPSQTLSQAKPRPTFGVMKGLDFLLVGDKHLVPKKAPKHQSLMEHENTKNREDNQKQHGDVKRSTTGAVRTTLKGSRLSSNTVRSRKPVLNPYKTSRKNSKPLHNKVPMTQVPPLSAARAVLQKQTTQLKPASTAPHSTEARTQPAAVEKRKDTSSLSSGMPTAPPEKRSPVWPASNDDTQNEHDIQVSTMSSMGLNLAVGSAARRQHRSRSVTFSLEDKKTKTEADDLVVMGKMLSASTSSSVLSASKLHQKDGEGGPTTLHNALNGVRMNEKHRVGNRILPPMKPLGVGTTENADTKVGSESSVLGEKLKRKQQRSVNNDNFIRLNMRNGAGSCRGARNKKSKNRFHNNKWKKGNFYKQQKSSSEWDDDNPNQMQDRRPPQREIIQRAETFRAGVDPLDDYLDGVLAHEQPSDGSVAKKAAPLTQLDPPTEAATTNKGTPTLVEKKQDAAPKCARHQRHCKLLVVKKTTTGNKGRKFYCCSMPKGEQCDHFQWADDTVEAAKRALLKNASHSGFIARQVAAYMERFQKLTVPELREAVKRRNLDTSGKKQQLLLRLSIWVRDELAEVTKVAGDESTTQCTKEDEIIHTSGLSCENEEDDDSCNSSKGESESSNLSSDDEELDIFDAPGSMVHWGINEDKPPPTHSDTDSDEPRVHPSNNGYQTLVNKSDHSRKKSTLNEGPSDVEESKSSEIREVLSSLFGYSHLREGQEWAIKRCLEKQKSLLVAPTGFGKSMCYVLPGALMDGVCIVVSPLISLIQDQLRELPPRVPAATLSGSLSTAAIASIVDDVIRKRIKIIFVSPERLASASFQRLFQPKWNKETNSMERPFPPVSLLCVDEAHCLSQWAHNFRPSYLRLRSMLDKIKPQSVLAITATAGRQVVKDICETLDIEMCSNAAGCGSSQCSCGVWTMKADRDNINVETHVASSQELRLSMLVKLLKPCSRNPEETAGKEEDIQAGCLANGCVIVYVWRQKDTEVVAESIQASGVPGGVVCYHGGMDSSARSNAYSKFMRGKARICVATVAFGLGVNKADIEGIVHMYLPASPEHFLQEIGRAGRDGRAAKAVALVLREEVLVRHSQVHTDLIATSQLKTIILRFRDKVRSIIDSLSCDHWSQVPAIGVPIPLEEFSSLSDCKAETIETVFSLLELRAGGSSPYLQVEGTTIDQVTISLKRRKISKLAEREAVIGCVEKCAVCVDPPVGEKAPEVIGNGGSFACDKENSRHHQFVAYSFGSYRFSVTECANLLGPTGQPRHVFAALRRLQSNGEIELKLESTAKGRALRIIINNEGLRLFLDENGSSESLESLVRALDEQLSAICSVSASKVLDINFMMHEVAEVVAKSKAWKTKKESRSKSESLQRFQQLTKQYFSCRDGERLCQESRESLPWFAHDFSEKEVLIDSLSIISELGKESSLPTRNALKVGEIETLDYTALSVTKFLHGIATVRVPFSVGYQHRLFGKWQAVRFAELLATVKQLLESQWAGSKL